MGGTFIVFVSVLVFLSIWSFMQNDPDRDDWNDNDLGV